MDVANAGSGTASRGGSAGPRNRKRGSSRLWWIQKLKTKKGVKKRFKLTSSGKVKRAKANKSHILTKKSRKRKRSLRKATLVDKTMEKKIKKLMPYG